VGAAVITTRQAAPKTVDPRLDVGLRDERVTRAPIPQMCSPAAKRPVRTDGER